MHNVKNRYNSLMKIGTGELQLLAELKAQEQAFVAVEEDPAAILCPANLMSVGDADYDFGSVASMTQSCAQ